MSMAPCWRLVGKSLAIASAWLSLVAGVSAGSCRASRTPAKRLEAIDEPVFAIPVARVVVVATPAFFYSYRAAAGTSGAPHSPPTASAPLDKVIPAERILRTHCAKCHQGDAPVSGLAFFTSEGGLLTALPRRAMLEMASPDESGVALMPPGDAPKLSAEELAVLREWAKPPRDLRY